MRKLLYEKVIPHFPKFHPYVCRDFCAIARLIETKIENGGFDIYEVYDWFQYSGISLTENYIKDSKRYYSIYNKSWVKSVLKSPQNWREENRLKSKQHNFFKVLNENIRYDEVRICRYYTRPYLIKISKLF